jgi:hypothetical protein
MWSLVCQILDARCVFLLLKTVKEIGLYGGWGCPACEWVQDNAWFIASFTAMISVCGPWIQSFSGAIVTHQACRTLKWVTQIWSHYTQISSVEVKSHDLFCPSWPWTVILQISASCIAGMNKWVLPCPGTGWEYGVLNIC